MFSFGNLLLLLHSCASSRISEGSFLRNGHNTSVIVKKDFFYYFLKLFFLFTWILLLVAPSTDANGKIGAVRQTAS